MGSKKLRFPNAAWASRKAQYAASQATAGLKSRRLLNPLGILRRSKDSGTLAISGASQWNTPVVCAVCPAATPY